MARTTLCLLIFVLHILPILAASVPQTTTLNADTIDITGDKEDTPTAPGTPLNNAPTEKQPNIHPEQDVPSKTDEENESKPSEKKNNHKIELFKEPEIDKPKKGHEWKFDEYLVQTSGKKKSLPRKRRNPQRYSLREEAMRLSWRRRRRQMLKIARRCAMTDGRLPSG